MPPRRNVKKVKPTKRMRKNTNTKKAITAYSKRMPMYRGISSIPFPKIRNCTFIYKQPSVTLTSSGLTGSLITRFRLNSLFDFDVDNNFSDKQPLFFDQMFSSSGPYKYYKVNAWSTTVTVTNLTDRALHSYYDQGVIGSIVDSDTALEAQNRAGVQYSLLTAQANSKPQTVFKSFKTTKSFAPRGVSSGLDYGASYNADPANQIVSTLLITNLDPTLLTTFSAVVSVTHKFFATCYLQDSVLS